MAVVTGIALAAGGAAVQYGSARKAEKKAKASSKEANQISAQASQALAAREARSRVPGFGDGDNIPGYSSPSSATRNINIPRFNDMDTRDNQLIPINQTTFNPQGGIQNFNDFIGDQIRQTQARQRNLDNRDRSLGREIPQSLTRFNEIAKRFPKSSTGKPIFPDPNTSEGEKFYKSLPKSVAEIVQDPSKAQMYKGSNIVNPYANVADLSAIAEDRSDLVTDRTGLLSDRTDLIQDRTDLLTDRTGLFESATDLGQDLSGRLTDLSTGQEDLSGRITDLRQGGQDFSGLASDTSILASNAFANLQVATQAADLQAQQSDQALANTLSTIRATGAGAGGATAIAQAALQSKLNISATIEQQEARNVQSRAQGQQQIEQIRMGESRRLQDIAFSERLRLEGLREREGLRIDDTRLDEGRALRDLSVSEGRRLQSMQVDEGRRLQELSIAERMREQGITFDESLRLQQADFDTARERDRFSFDEAGRLQEASFNEAGRMQQVQLAEALRVQEARMSEQQRLQQADAMSREYQFRVAETREQNRLNRLANQETQAVQNAASLEASAVAAKANRQGALVGGLTSLAGSVLSAGVLPGTKTPSDRKLKKNIELIGKSKSGLNIYMFEYIDKIFGSGIYQGVMSDEIPQYAVINHVDEYDRVDYSKIDVDFKEI